MEVSVIRSPVPVPSTSQEPGTSPEGPMPGNGGEDEDAEGAAELPEAMAPEAPLEPQEPRSPQQVGPALRPAKLEPAARPALGLRQSHGHGRAVLWPVLSHPGHGTPGQWVCPPPSPLGQSLPCPLPAEQLLPLRGVGWCPGCSCGRPGWQLVSEARLAGGRTLEAFAASLSPKGGLCSSPRAKESFCLSQGKPHTGKR